MERFLAEYLFAGMVRIYRQVTAADYSPLAVEFLHGRSTNAGAHHNFLRCPVNFGRLHNRFVTGAGWLDFALRSANLMAYRLARQHLESEAARTTGVSEIATAVERAIRLVRPHWPTTAEIALSLNLSERTLRRKLAKGGLSFNSLLDERRRFPALELIGNARMDLAQAEAEAGYAAVSNFRGALKRWTGRTPSENRG